MDLVHTLIRLVFEPNHDPLPRREDGGIDLDQVTAITVIWEVIDYHPREISVKEHNAVFMAATAVIESD